jgi:hypothetical protein
MRCACDGGAGRGREPNREIAELVLRHQKREAEALVVVLPPHPGPAHLRIRKTDGRAHQCLDRLRDGGHH